MNKCFTLGSAHEDDVTPRRLATSSPSGETIMTRHIVSFGAIVAIFTLPLAAYAQPIGGTAAPGAPTRPATGVVTSAPKGAGGAGHAAAGAILSADQSMKIHQFATKEKKPSVNVTEKLAVGNILPTNVELYPLPADVGVKDDYRYSVVNDHTVLVEARTHKFTQIID
jgi:hypothetical protein